MENTFLMGIDVGTTGAKAAVVDLQGNIIGSGYNEYPRIFPKPGWVEQDAELLVQSTFKSCREAVEDSGVESSAIVSIAFSSQRATIGLLNNENKVVDNRFYSWQDSRAVDEVEYIKTKMDAAHLYETAGQPISPSFGFEKILWISRNEPEKYNQAERIIYIMDYLMYRFGADGFFTERVLAASGGMYDIKKGEWSDEIIETFGLNRAKFSEIVDSGVKIGEIDDTAAGLSGLAEGTAICTGAGDNECGILGVGAIDSGDVVITAGTGGMILFCNDEPVFPDDQGLMVSPAASEELFILGGIQLSSASTFQWMNEIACSWDKTISDKMQLDYYEMINREVAGSPAGYGDLVFLPFLAGAGYPDFIPEARGVFCGLSFSHSRADMLRAVMEGVIFEFRYMFEKLKKSGVSIEKLTFTGGASKSDIWTQIVSDIFNAEVRRVEVADATLIGAAILAGKGVGVYENTKMGVEAMVKFRNAAVPEKTDNEKYEKLFKVYSAAYNSMVDGKVFSLLADCR